MRFFIYSAASFLVYLLCSCETHLPDPADQNPDDVQIAASSLVTTGDTVALRLAYTESFYDKVSEIYSDRSMLLRALMFPDTSRFQTDKYLMKKYYDELLLKVGKVELTTGTGERKRMEFNPETYDFECGHSVTPGERLEFSATLTSRKGKMLEVGSSTVVPGWKPDAEIVQATRRYKERQNREDLNLSEYSSDSVYELKILLKDPSPDLHCYKIKVRGVSYHYEGDSFMIDLGAPFNPRPYISTVKYDIVRWTDAFFTNDPLLYDAAITHSFGAWQPYTTDVFANRQFANGSYLLTVEARYPYTAEDDFIHRRFIEVQLLPISLDLMNYLTSLYRVRTAVDDYFSEPMSLSSNIKGGVGIFGSIGEPLTLRYWFPGEEDPDYPNGGHKASGEK